MVPLVLFFTNATKVNEFPIDGIAMNQISIAQNPEITCNQVIDLSENGVANIGSAFQNKQIVQIRMPFQDVIEIAVKDLTSGASTFHRMKFLKG